eukprot:maker-scaffold_33-snap-gene-3.80-mRNA-1 protein AED:0.34 eAED:0.34 QI:32/1/1/1/1/1/2/226/142
MPKRKTLSRVKKVLQSIEGTGQIKPDALEYTEFAVEALLNKVLSLEGKDILSYSKDNTTVSIKIKSILENVNNSDDLSFLHSIIPVQKFRLNTTSVAKLTETDVASLKRSTMSIEEKEETEREKDRKVAIDREFDKLMNQEN